MGDADQEFAFAAALASDRPIVMDGAMGTELTRLGQKIGSTDWVASTLGSAETVSRIHREYARAGAQVHIANTFATARHVLAEVGLEDQFEQINRGAVELCSKAISGQGPGNHWIAGSISTYVIGSDRANLPRGSRLDFYVREHAALLADAGCDLIVLEMLFDIEVCICMMKAASSAGLPVSIGLTCIRGGDGEVYLRGEYTGRPEHELKLSDALPKIIAATSANGTGGEVPWIVTIMHSDLDVTDDALKLVGELWSGPIAAYPNSGRLLPPDDWDHDSVCDTQTFLNHARSWANHGVQIVGGCCGVGPAHIAALAADWASD